MTGVPLSGKQFEIRHGDQRATIVEVGGGIRAYEVAGRPVLDPYPLDSKCDGAHGALLIPWPNRLGDGRYRFDGVDYQVDLTEPDKRNAIHGFLRWRSWRTVEPIRSRVLMTTCLYPLKGYPFVLDVRVAYELGDDGLTVATTATNLGEQPCPYGRSQHPYLSPGTGLIDDCTLHLDATTRILTGDNRQLPEGRQPVEGTPYDFRAGNAWGTSGWTSRSPTSPAAAKAGHGFACPRRTGRVRSCGSTSTTRSSSCSPATLFTPTGDGGG